MTIKKMFVLTIYILSLMSVWGMKTYIGNYLSQANRDMRALNQELMVLYAENSRLEIAYSNLSSPSSVAILTAKFLPEMTRASESQFVSREWFFENNLVYHHNDYRLAVDDVSSELTTPQP
ncbi:MAG: hypothetical protein ACR2NY_06935 [Alphaproteobacteria bacterium]